MSNFSFGLNMAREAEKQHDKEREELLKLKELLADDELASKIAGECNDKLHDPRWCPTCENRECGISDYRTAIEERLKQEEIE